MTSIVARFVQKYGRLPTEYDPDYLEMLRMSKYRILTIPDVNPAKCANCGSCKQDGRKYIDFGLQVDWYGAVFLCSLCLGDISKEMGLFRPYEVEICKLENKIAENNTLHLKGAELEKTVLSTFEEVKEHFNNLHALDADSGVNSTSNVGASEEESSKSGTDAPKPRTTKPASSTGSKNLSSLANLLNS